MNAYIAEQLVRDHMNTLEREARDERLAREARGGEARRWTVARRGTVARLANHRPARGRLGRAVALLLGPAGS